MKQNIRSYKNHEGWSDIEAAKLPESLFGTAMLEKRLTINILELLVTLLGCSIWRSNDMKVSLRKDEYHSLTS